MIQREEWNGFEGRKWREEVNVRDFVQNNYTPYDGDQSFLAGPTDATKKLFDELQKLQRAEFTKKSVGLDGKERTGVLDMDTDIVTGITAHKPGYINESMSKYEQKMVEMGAAEFDKDKGFVLKDTTKKGWEDFATMLSVGASVIGLAMGVPIIPINFRKITNKDEKDAKIREFQKQYTDIMAGNAAKVEDVKSSAEAGKLAKANEDDINAYSKYKEDVGAYEAKSTIDTESEKDLIDAQSQARLKELQAQAVNNEALLKLEQAHDAEMAKLSSDLSTASAKELTAYSKTGWLVEYIRELKAQKLENKDIALAIAGLGGTTPTQMGLKNAESIVGMVTDTFDTAGNVIGSVFGKGKKK